VVQFHTDPNLEDFLAKELQTKLGLSIPVIEPTNTGLISISLDLDQLVTVIQHPLTLWTVKKARIALFSINLDDKIALESAIRTEMELVSQLLQKLNFMQVNCRIIARERLPIPRRQVLGLVKSLLQQSGIILQFQRQLPELYLGISSSKCRGYLEIGKSFAYPAPLKVHHTPLSTAAAYALFHLAQQVQSPKPCILLDPMCGNGTLVLVGAFESRVNKTAFSGIGIDRDATVIANARENLSEDAGDIHFLEGLLEQLDPNTLPLHPNVILTHPPYGFAPAIDSQALEMLYDTLFQAFLKFPGCIYGIVTPHQPLLVKFTQKYHLKTEILRPFKQKTLPSYLWVGKFSYD
jgi:hypothetical protein